MDEPNLPTWIREAYETLEAEYASGIDELSHTDATERLLAEGGNIEEEADAVYAIDRLLDRGWLYEVNDQLRKTEWLRKSRRKLANCTKRVPEQFAHPLVVAG